METIAQSSWMPADFCLTANGETPDDALAAAVYERVCRTDFSAPGFCLIDLGEDWTSVGLRRFMIALKRAMQPIHRQRQGRDLAFVSAARFDQQITTKPHRDGGPEESFLLLGYEPSQVPAEIVMVDYSKCARDMGLTPQELLEKHNPMFHGGEQLLRPYATRVTCFSHLHYQVVLINNSAAPYSDRGDAWQGVLHTATVFQPSDELRRVVNSTMIASMPIAAPEPVSAADQEDFITTNVVRRRGYDKPHLEDGV